jgi:excisionase family DNA binding protein
MACILLALLDRGRAVIVLALDPATAGHLAVAIRRHRAHLRSNGHLVPAGLAELEAAAVQVVRDKSRQTATVGDSAVAPADDTQHAGERGCEPLTIGQVAAALSVHPRTVGRMLDRGDLPAVTVGRRRRIPQPALDRYLGGSR